MKKHRLIRAEIVLVLFFLFAAGRRAGAEFIYGGIGSRASGMGGSFVSVTGTPETIFYNPAGIVGGAKWNLCAGFTDLFSGNQALGMHLFHAAGVYNGFNIGSLAAGLTTFSLTGYQEMQIYFSYARQVINNLYIGFSPRLLRWASIGYEGKDPIYNIYVKDKNFSKMSFSADAGIIYSIYGNQGDILSRLISPGDLTMGFAVRDFIKPNIANNGNESGKLPLTLEMGFSYKYRSILMAAVLQRRGGLQKLSGGVEYSLKKISSPLGEGMLIVRGGGCPALFRGSTPEINGGLSFHFREYAVHYALSQKTEMAGLGITHSISVQYQF